MSDILFQYDRISPATWVYMSSLLTIALYFKFSRVWSVRNLDLVLLILLAPGLLMVIQGRKIQREDAFAEANSPAASLPRDGTPEIPPAGRPIPGSQPLDDLLAVDAGNPAEQPISRSLVAPDPAVPPKISRGERVEAAGFIWLLSVGLLLLVRLLVDPNMVRRPLLEPNLTAGGLTFIGCALFVFLMANIINGAPNEDDLRGPEAAESLIARRDTSGDADTLNRYGPGLGLIYMLPTISTGAIVTPPADLPHGEQQHFDRVVAAKTMAILSHLAIIAGMIFIGARHFDNIKMGLGAAVLYLLLPYMAEMSGHVPHALPGALLVWAIAFYRRPLVAGMFLGLAAGTIYYGFFLLPLWISFYWQRGLARFLIGFAAMVAILAASLMFNSPDAAAYWLQFKGIFGIRSPAMEDLEGIWRVWDPAYRISILAAFIALSGTLALWPPRKNLGTLLSCSAAIMLAAQFWHGHVDGGGMYMAWYLPLLLLTVFRPNLEDRIAIAVLTIGRWPRLAALTRAA